MLKICENKFVLYIIRFLNINFMLARLITLLYFNDTFFINMIHNRLI